VPWHTTRSWAELIGAIVELPVIAPAMKALSKGAAGLMEQGLQSVQLSPAVAVDQARLVGEDPVAAFM
jgi:hypothetical protein